MFGRIALEDRRSGILKLQRGGRIAVIVIVELGVSGMGRRGIKGGKDLVCLPHAPKSTRAPLFFPEMHALTALVSLVVALQASGKPAGPLPPPEPVITPPPTPVDVGSLKGRDDTLTIPLASCLLNVECCDMVLTLPVLDDSFTTLLPFSAPIPIPTLGPFAGLLCSPATDLDILGNECIAGGTPLCCQENLLLDIVAEGCQEVLALPTITLPSLPLPLPTIPLSLPLPISLPPILGGDPSSSGGLLGLPLPSLPPILGGDPTSSGGLLGLPITLPPILGGPTPTSSGLLGLPLPSLPPILGGDPSPTSSGLLGLPIPISLPGLGGDPAPTTSGGLLGLPITLPPILGGDPAPAPTTSGGLLGLPITLPPILGGDPAPAPTTSSGGLLGLPISLPPILGGSPPPAPAPAPTTSSGGLLGLPITLPPILGGNPTPTPTPAPAPAPTTSGGLLGLPISLPFGLVSEEPVAEATAV